MQEHDGREINVSFRYSHAPFLFSDVLLFFHMAILLSRPISWLPIIQWPSSAGWWTKTGSLTVGSLFPMPGSSTLYEGFSSI